MTPLAVLLLTLPVAAPVPQMPPVPSLEGKYTLLTSVANTGRGARGSGGVNPFGEAGFSGPASARRETTITKDTIVIDGRTATWEYKIDPTTKPLGIDITITPLRGKKTKVLGILEVTGDRLNIAYAAEGEARPKDFEDAEGVSHFIFQKAPPPPRAEYKIVVLKVGHEADAEKAINALAKEGYEVTLSTAPAQPKGGNPDEPVIHIVLKRMVK